LTFPRLASDVLSRVASHVFLVTWEGITMERRLAVVLATLLGSFSILWIINFKVVAIDQALILFR